MLRIANVLRSMIRKPPAVVSMVLSDSSKCSVPMLRVIADNHRPAVSLLGFRNYCSLIADECWKCKHVLVEAGNLFCPECSVLQKTPSDLNYFEVLGLSPEYSIVPADLTKQFRKLQSLLHPDKFTTKSPEEKANSDDWSALVNRAYKTILLPLTRAEYLLRLNGVAIPEDNSVLDAEFLMEMMEKNEEIEEAEDKALLLEILQKNQTEIKDLLPELEDAFVTGYFEQAVRTLIRMRYLYSIENSIHTKGQRLGFVLDTNN